LEITVSFSSHKGADRTENVTTFSTQSITSADCRAGQGYILYLLLLYQDFGTVKTKLCVAKKVLWWTSLLETGTVINYDLKVSL